MKQRLFFSLAFMLITGMILSSCFKQLPDKHIVFDCDFNDYNRKGIELYNHAGKIDSAMVFLYNGSPVLGRFNNNLVTFTMDTLPTHNAVHIQFDLFIHDKWDGNYLDPISGIPDVWNIRLDNNLILVTTFSNGTKTQAFPDYYNPGVTLNPAHSNAWALFPGVCASAAQNDGTSYYKFDYITSHTASKITIDMNDALQPFNSLCLKSWSLDNIKITAIQYN